MNMRLLLVLPVIVCLSAALALGQAVSTGFSGGGVGSNVYIDWGKFLCPGGEPVGPWPPIPPCSQGSRVHVRDMVYQGNFVATDSRVTGKYVNVFNANTDGWTRWGPGSGPLWGTTRLEVMEGTYPDWTPTGEVWEGTWTGEREVTSDGALSTIHLVMQGTGGRIEGLKSEWEMIAPHTSPLGFTGRILVPGGKW